MSNHFDSLFIVASKSPNFESHLTSFRHIHEFKREKEYKYEFLSREVKLLELEVSHDSFQLFEKLRTEHPEFSELKLVPSRYLCSVYISSISDIASASEIFYLLKQLTPGMKKLTLIDDPLTPGLNQKICFVEYENFLYAKNALKALNNKPVSLQSNSDQLLYNKTFLKLSPEIAHFCEPFVDMVKETLCNTSCFFIQNINFTINYNILKLRECLEKFGVVASLRFYNHQILVQFASKVSPDFYKKQFFFEGKLCPVVPAMRPNKNIEKYRERIAKVLPFQLTEEDRQILVSRFAENASMLNELIRKKAEIVAVRIFDSEYNRINHSKINRDEQRNKKRKRSESNESKNYNNINNYSNDNNRKEDRHTNRRTNRSYSPDDVNNRNRSIKVQPTNQITPTLPAQTNHNPNLSLQLLASLGLLASAGGNNPNILNVFQQLLQNSQTSTQPIQQPTPKVAPLITLQPNPPNPTTISQPPGNNYSNPQLNPNYTFNYPQYPQNLTIHPNIGQNISPNIPQNYNNPGYNPIQYNPEMMNQGPYYPNQVINQGPNNYEYQGEDMASMQNLNQMGNLQPGNMNTFNSNQNSQFEDNIKKYYQQKFN